MKHYKVVCAVIYNEKNEIFCCRRGPGRVLEGLYEFPGGKVELNETKEQAIIREIKEELLTDIEVIEYIGEYETEYSLEETSPFDPFKITLYAYKCNIISGDLKLTEHTESKWVLKSELDKLEFAKADVPFIKYL